MDVLNLKTLSKSILPLKQLGFDVEECFRRICKINKSFDINQLKTEIDFVERDEKFDLVTLALESGLISYKERPKLDVDNLLIFAGNLYKGDYIANTLKISKEDKDLFSEVVGGVDLKYFENIHYLLEYEEFNFLKFETKIMLRQYFGENIYVNADILLFIKKLIWDFLYPDFYSAELIKSTSIACVDLIRENKKNEGWLSLESFKNELDIDDFLISKLNLHTSIKYLNHYNNDLRLGFVKQF